jgi:hypothetical protein
MSEAINTSEICALQLPESVERMDFLGQLLIVTAEASYICHVYIEAVRERSDYDRTRS